MWVIVLDTISNCNGDIPESCLVELTPEAREKICEHIQKIQDKT